MAAGDERFEIWGCDARGWTVAASCETEAAANELAHERRRSGYAAVRVVRLSYQEENGGYVERELLFLGDRQTTPPLPDSGKREDGGSLCATLSDFYAPRSRRAVKRLLADWLARMNLTAVELLHHPEYVGKLENSGTAMQGAVQRAAIAQGRGGGNVQERMREIFNIVDKATARLRLDARGGKLPRIVDGDVNAVLAKLPTGPDRAYVFSVALTDWIRNGKSLGAKLAELIELLPAAQPEALALIDAYAAEFVEDAAALTELLGPMPHLGAAVLRIADIAQGRYAARDGGADPLATLSRLIAAGNLPRCREALIRRVAGTLKGPRELTDGGLAGEIAFNQDLKNRLTGDSGEMIGGDEIRDAFESRVERHIHPEAIGKLLDRLTSPIERLNRLLDIEPGVPPGSHKNRLGEYMLPIVMLPANESLFVDAKQPLAERLRALAQLQRRIAGSGFHEVMRGKATAKLDEYCTTLVRSSGILDKIDRGADRISDKGIAILRLCAAGLFTDGQAIETAGRMALRYLKHPAFLPAYLGEGDEESKRQKLLTLRHLLEQAGMADMLTAAAQPQRTAAGG